MNNNLNNITDAITKLLEKEFGTKTFDTNAVSEAMAEAVSKYSASSKTREALLAAIDQYFVDTFGIIILNTKNEKIVREALEKFEKKINSSIHINSSRMSDDEIIKLFLETMF